MAFRFSTRGRCCSPVRSALSPRCLSGAASRRRHPLRPASTRPLQSSAVAPARRLIGRPNTTAPGSSRRSRRRRSDCRRKLPVDNPFAEGLHVGSGLAGSSMLARAAGRQGPVFVLAAEHKFTLSPTRRQSRVEGHASAASPERARFTDGTLYIADAVENLQIEKTRTISTIRQAGDGLRQSAEGHRTVSLASADNSSIFRRPPATVVPPRTRWADAPHQCDASEGSSRAAFATPSARWLGVEAALLPDTGRDWSRSLFPRRTQRITKGVSISATPSATGDFLVRNSAGAARATSS